MNNRKKTWLIVLLTFIFIAAIVWFVAMANKDKDLPRATTYVNFCQYFFTKMLQNEFVLFFGDLNGSLLYYITFCESLHFA
ncbi:hypothetical protein [Treponema sp. R6D11]